MIIEREKIAALVKNYLPHADEKTMERVIGEVEDNADAVILTMIYRAIENEGKQLHMH